MPTLTEIPLRFACNVQSREPAPGVGSTDKVIIYRGNPFVIQAAEFNGTPATGTLVDVSNVIMANLVIRKDDKQGTVLIEKVLDAIDINDTLTYSQWTNGTSEHFSFSLSDVDTNQVVPSDGDLDIYGAISVVTDTGELTIGFFEGVIQEDGVGNPELPDLPDYTTYSRAEINNLIAGHLVEGIIDFADISGTISVDQLPPGSIASIDTIGADAFYFFNNTTGLPELISASEATDFISGHLDFGDITGTISVGQLPPGSVVSVDPIGEDALYFFDDSSGLPSLISSSGVATFISGNLSFGDITGTLSLAQLPPGTAATVDPIGENALFFFDDSTSTPNLISAAETAAFLSGNLSFSDLVGTIALEQFPSGTVTTLDSIDEDGFYFFDNALFQPELLGRSDTLSFLALAFSDIGGTVGIEQLPPGTAATIEPIDEDAFFFFNDSTGLPELKSVSETATILSVGGGSGSYLSSHAVRVDPDGDDDTGTVGDLSKPFATLQAACDALVADGSSIYAVVYIPQNAGAIGGATTALTHLTLIGPGQWGTFLPTLQFTETTGNVSVSFVNVYSQDVIAHTAGRLIVGLTSSELRDISNDAGKVTLAADTSASQVRNVTAADEIYAWGLGNAGTFSASGQDIHLVNISPIYDDGSGVPSGPTIDSAGSEVWATSVTLQDVTCDTLHLIDSRVVGTNSATTTTYADVLLAPRDGLQLFDDSHVLALDAGDRKLYASDGTTVIFDYSTSVAAARASLGAGTSSFSGAFSALSGIPTTIAGYGITDFNSLGDARWSVLAHTHTFASLTSTPTTLSGYGITDAQPIDSDLTTIAGLTATTDNFIVSVSSAWASRTPSQVRTTLGLVIGTNVQAWDADLDTWSAITRASGFDTFVATPTLANLNTLITGDDVAGLAAANNFTVAQTVTLAPAANTYVDGIILTDTTTASSGNQQYSPGIHFTGQGWKTTATAASQAVDFRAYVVPVQGTTNPTANFVLESSINGGAYGNPFTLGSDGSLSATVFLLSAGGANARFKRSSGGRVGFGDSSSSIFAVIPTSNTQTIGMTSGVLAGWANSTTDAGAALDTAFARNAAGVVEINNGTAGTHRDLIARDIYGPLAATMTHQASIPTAAATSTAGNAATFRSSDAIAGTSTAGAAAGGDATLQSGDAKRLTSGNANGGDVTLRSGAAIGSGTNGIINFNTGGTLRWKITGAGVLTASDGYDIAVGTSTGTKIGAATTQKLGFWNVTPVVQPAAALQAAITNSTGGTQDGTLVDVTTSALADPAKVNSNFTDIYALLDAIRTALVNTGIMKGAA